MPTTPYLGLEDQNNGSNSNTWGDVADSNFSILEQSIARITTITTTGGTTTLTVQQNRFPLIRIVGALVSNATIVVLTSEKNWTFINATTGGFTVTVKTAAGTGMLVPQGGAAQLYCDGANVMQTNVAFPSGTRMLFQQNTAPVGWTKDTNPALNHALRVTGGAVGGGGNVAFTNVFAPGRAVVGNTGATAINGWVNYHTLSWNEMPAHTHDVIAPNDIGGVGIESGNNYRNVEDQWRTTTSAGSSWGHTHGWGNDAHSHSVSIGFEMDVAYLDVIIAQKD